MSALKYYVVYCERDGYMCEDEDRIGGLHYTKEMDESTLLFTNKETAEREAYSWERVIETEFDGGIII